MVHRDVITEEQPTSCWLTTIIMCKGKHTATSLDLSHSSALHFLAKVKELVIAWESVSESTEMGPQSSNWHPKAHVSSPASLNLIITICADWKEIYTTDFLNRSVSLYDTRILQLKSEIRSHWSNGNTLILPFQRWPRSSSWHENTS